MISPEDVAGELLQRMLADTSRHANGTRRWYRVTKKKYRPRDDRRKTMNALVMMLGLLGHKYEIRAATHYFIRLVD